MSVSQALYSSKLCGYFYQLCCEQKELFHHADVYAL